MERDERIMLGYVRLARLSHERRQAFGADKLLVLAGAAACRAGCLNVAARCRQLVLAHNPRHVLGKTASFPDAMRDEEFQPFLRSLERACPWERAEHLLAEQGLDAESANTAEDDALERLQDAAWQ